MRRIWWPLPFVAVAAIWAAYQFWLPLVRFYLDRTADLTSAGTFGDAFGALNTLFSGLAFAGIIITIVLQAQELRETRDELRGQRIQLERQAFENAFFQMLGLHNDIVESFQYTSPFNGKTTRGKACFAVIKDDLKRFLTDAARGIDVETRYESFFRSYAHWNLGHYFRNLYQVVNYVAKSNVEKKKFYSNIVRAQLSSDELFLLLYNALSVFGREKFLPLVVEFELLEHLPEQGEIPRQDAVKIGARAFGDNPEWKRLLNTVLRS